MAASRNSSSADVTSSSKDQFWVDGRGGNLADSYWNTNTHNEIGGPEIGIRYMQPVGRFSFSVESRFMAGINGQDIGQNGVLGSQLFAGIPQNNGISLVNVPPLPTLMSATAFTHSTHFVEFLPLIELRAEARMKLTNMITVKAGYTGIFINNVARAADMINYTVPNMGITRDLNGNLQPVYIQGLTLGIEFNRDLRRGRFADGPPRARCGKATGRPAAYSAGSKNELFSGHTDVRAADLWGRCPD